MIRVLAVDDDDAILESLELSLGGEFDVQVAPGGNEALRRLRAERFDVVLLDVMMPVVDGITVARTLRAEGNEVPIVLASANGNVPRLAGQLGLQHWLHKPFDLGRLESTLRDAAVIAAGR